MSLRFGVFDHIEPLDGISLKDMYDLRLIQIEALDKAGFYAYHLAEHHSPAVHSLAPSQNVFLAAVSQKTEQLRFGPCVYVLPLHHPLRLIEEISMLDHMSGGRMEIGVGRGGVMEAYFWGQEADSDINFARYQETLDIIRKGLNTEELTHDGQFHSFDALPMRLQPIQRPYPPLWYMRNAETAALEGMNTVIVGTLDSLRREVVHYRRVWAETHGEGAPTAQGQEPKIGLVVHMVVDETDDAAIKAATPAWEKYRWNLAAPRRMEAEKRGLTQFQGESSTHFICPAARSDGISTRSSNASTPRRTARTRRGSAASRSPGRRIRSGVIWRNIWTRAPIISCARSNGATCRTKPPCAPSACSPRRSCRVMRLGLETMS